MIIFLHGLGGSRTSWDPQLESLASSFRCVAWDMPGYGASPPLTSLTFATAADALAGLVADLGVSRASFVGESMGGMHALHTALRHPSLIHRLVLTNSSPAFGVDGTDVDEWKRSRLSRIDAGESPSDIARDIYSGIAGPELSGCRLEQRIASFARVRTEGFRAAVECLPTHDVRSSLESITAETLVIAGELDSETPVAYSEQLVAGLTSAELVVMAGAGHIAASEFPVQFNELLREFFTRKDLS